MSSDSAPEKPVSDEASKASPPPPPPPPPSTETKEVPESELVPEEEVLEGDWMRPHVGLLVCFCLLFYWFSSLVLRVF